MIILAWLHQNLPCSLFEEIHLCFTKIKFFIFSKLLHFLLGIVLFLILLNLFFLLNWTILFLVHLTTIRLLLLDLFDTWVLMMYVAVSHIFCNEETCFFLRVLIYSTRVHKPHLLMTRGCEHLFSLGLLCQFSREDFTFNICIWPDVWYLQGDTLSHYLSS